MNKALVVTIMLLCATAKHTYCHQVDKVNMECQDPDNCGGHGKCIVQEAISVNQSRNQCQCEEAYTSLKSPCDYRQKSQLVAFLLSLFLGPFGADWFYLAQDSGSYIAQRAGSVI